MDKISLLYIITKLELGGAQKQLLRLISLLDKEKYDVCLFTASEGLLFEDASHIENLKVKKSKFLERPINPLVDLLAFCELYWFIRHNRFRIVHTHSSKAGILGRIAARLADTGAVIVHTVHGWSFNDFQGFLTKNIFICLEKLVSRFTDKIIVVSDCDKKRGLANRIGTPDKYVLVRYGIDYKEFSVKYTDIKKEAGLEDADLVVGTISCFKPQKSLEDFIRLAFLVKQVLPSVKFILIGDGVKRKYLKKLIRNLNLDQQVILTGWRNDVSRLLQAMDVFVLTSLWEGLPVTVLEAMAASRPVLVTDTGGVKEAVIDGKTGFIVGTHRLSDMRDKLLLLLRDADLRASFGFNARKCLDSNFSLESVRNNHQDLYVGLLEHAN